ncbi:MAG: ATP-binding protein [Oscillospiraceae bacterium]|nr:ATP-binding protein [Oscillospiraceae bacterium]MCL2278970.1 ATP-binding protein [Oscillospiraceae bacterium]
MKIVSEKLYNLSIKTKVITIIFVAAVVAISMVVSVRAVQIRKQNEAMVVDSLRTNIGMAIGIFQTAELYAQWMIDTATTVPDAEMALGSGIFDAKERLPFFSAGMGIVVANNEGIIFFSNRTAYVGRNINELGIAELFGEIPFNTMLEIRSAVTGIEKMVYISKEPELDWIFISFVYPDDIEDISSVIFFSMLPTVSAIILVAIGLVMIVNKSLSRLTTLAHAAREISKGNLEVELLEVNSNDEISQVSKAFSEVVSTLMAHIKQVESSRTEAENASKSKSDFLSKMSHEMRTPMNAILGMSEIILAMDVSEKVLTHAKTIKQSGNHLLSLINEILDISKVESGKLEIANRRYLFHSVVNDVVSIIRARNSNAELRFYVYMENDTPNALIGDEVRVRQILLNVLSNALKYTKNGHFSLEIRSESSKEDYVTLTMTIKDTGIGIKSEELNILFDEFTQLNTWTNREIEGTGLGLAITRNLLGLMGGTIEVQSVYGEGSEFTIVLPQKIQSPDTLPAPPATDPYCLDDFSCKKFVDKFTAPDAHILVVDDVDINLLVAKAFLEPYGVKIELLAGGEDAVDAVAIGDYDLVFMDQMMPGMDGIEAVKIIREMDGEKFSSLPIVALTANAIVGVKEMFLENGFDDFISKPIDMENLHSILLRYLPPEKIHFT